VNKEEFMQYLTTSDADEATVDGTVEDDTQEPAKESAFAPVSEAEIENMQSLMTEMAEASDVNGAVNREVLAEAKAKKLTRIPFRKISGKDFFHLKNDKEYFRQSVGVIESRQSGASTLFLVAPKVVLPTAIRKELKRANVYTGVTATREFFLLYIFKNDTTWYTSAIEMMRLALNNWIKVEANMSAGGYDYYPAPMKIANPDWTALPSFDELLALAFRGRIIESANHPVILKMLGVTDGGSVADDGAL
jgi:hypothetical protein